jgi:4-hydroxybenzoate polyprenyltransferase
MLLAFFKLIRWKNLLLIALTQYCIRYFLISAMLKFMNLGIILQMSHFNFFLLTLSTMLIAAAGYIINDYFDTKIDGYNNPTHVIVGKQISRRQAMFLHSVLNIIAVALGFYLGYKSGMPRLGLIHLFSTGLLWFYSTDFKKQLIVGNVVVAMLTAIVPLLVVLYEMPLLINKYRTVLSFSGTNLNFVIRFVFGYAAFAFITTLIREIIKDMEDYLGDEKFGCNTLPIAYGIKNTKRIVYALIIITMCLLFTIQLKQLASLDLASFLYFGIAFQLLLTVLIFLVKKAQTPVQYHKASRVLKVVMLLGVAYTGLYYYLLLY